MKSTIVDIRFLIDLQKDMNHIIHQIVIDEEALFLWFARILKRDSRLINEMQGYSIFQSLILERVLGYDHLTLQSNVGTQRKVEFVLGHEKSPPRCVIEVKGLGTDLFKIQSGRARVESPIDQARNYARNQQAPYGVATDYNEFVFCPFSAPDHISFQISIEELFEKKEPSSFDASRLTTMTSDSILVEYLQQHFNLSYSKTRVFLAMFHKIALIDERIIDSLKQNEFKHRHKLTTEFYKRFHETRLQLIWEIQNQNTNLDLSSVIHVSQLILNRWLFICYAENMVGKNLLPSETTNRTIAEPITRKKILKSRQTVIKSELSSLFSMLKFGEPMRGIHDYDGGLFEESIENIIIRDWINVDELQEVSIYSGQSELSEITKSKKGSNPLFEKTPRLEAVYNEYLNHGIVIHPVWINLLRIAGYDYQEEISVEMMGHVFEQSITDIEKIMEQGKLKKIGKRKKQGVYYTPDFITEYITKHGICSYLLGKIQQSSARPVIQIQEVINIFIEYSSLDTLEDLIENIRILDPACGSGAFLNKAVDVLLEFHQKIRLVREEKLLEAKPTKKKRKKKDSDSQIQLELTSWLSNLTNQVLLNNIFGVDLNEESALITRLSLFLKILSTEKVKLPVLDKNIRIGNSVVNDRSVDSRAFNWSQEFGGDGFDVVIGNPPYVKLQNLDSEIRTVLKNEYSDVIDKGNYDLYLPFLYRGWKLLSEDGFLGFIIPNKLFVTEYGKQLVKLLVQEDVVKHIVDFTWEQVFTDATTYTALIFLSAKGNHSKNEPYYQRVIDLGEWKNNIHGLQVNRAEHIPFNINNLNLLFKDELEVVNLIRKKGKSLGSGIDALAHIFVGLQTSADAVYILDYKTDTIGGTKIFSNYLEKKTNSTESTLVLEPEALKQLMMGQDIHRYEKPQPIRRLIFPYEVTSISHEKKSVRSFTDEEINSIWPSTYKYLLLCKERLAKRYEADKLAPDQWIKYVYDKNLDKFGTPKLICQVLSSRCNFVFDENGEVYFPGSGGGSGGYGVILRNLQDSNPTREDYLELLAILNSMLIDFYVKLFSSKFQRGFFSYSKMYLEGIPIVINSRYRSRLVQNAENLIEAYSKLVVRTKSFDGWFSLKVPNILKSFTIAAHLNTSEGDFKALIHEYSKRIGSESLETIASEFKKTKKILLRLHNEIKEKEHDIDNCVFKIYGLNKQSSSTPEITLADIVKVHPFIRLFGSYST